MGLISINTGTRGVTLNFSNIDNMVSVDINADGPQGNGRLGWSRVFEANSSGLGYYGGNYTVSLDPYLAAYQSNGASSVTLSIVASNWTSAGSVVGSIQYPNNSTPISITPAEWTSQQNSYTLVF